jgi:phytoene synthase
LLKGRGYSLVNLDFWQECVNTRRMFTEMKLLSPPKRLALAYSRGRSRAFWELILAHDVRLAQIIGNSSEPLIGQMRLAWWRDVIAKPAAARPSGEPLLARLAEIEAMGVADITRSAMLALLDGWGELLANEDWTPHVLNRYAAARANGVFTAFARMAGVAPMWIAQAELAGREWALADLMTICQTQQQHDAVCAVVNTSEQNYRLPRALRPLSILAFSAKPHAGYKRRGLRLIFNALTGR